MNHPLIAESFHLTQLLLPSLISSQHKDGGAITNLLSHFLCCDHASPFLFFSSLIVLLTILFYFPFFLTDTPPTLFSPLLAGM